jgi:arabinogalactan endo-1,4-beta-galactosidase
MDLRIKPAALVVFALIATRIASADDDFAKGVDLSILKYTEDHDVQFKIDGKAQDALSIFKSNGCNWVRLRLFVNPPGTDGQVNSLAYTLAEAKRVKQAGMKFCLDIHYSDQWADPGHQIIPADWKNLSHAQLISTVHDYTIKTLQAFDQDHSLPDMVAVGNEVTNGMMWPDAGPMHGETKWPALIDLLRAGISAVRETAASNKIKVMIHIDKGGDKKVCDSFFTHCQTAKLDFDVIGLSYYPFWHGTLDQLSDNLAATSRKFGKDIYVVETA